MERTLIPFAAFRIFFRVVMSYFVTSVVFSVAFRWVKSEALSLWRSSEFSLSFLASHSAALPFSSTSPFFLGLTKSRTWKLGEIISCFRFHRGTPFCVCIQASYSLAPTFFQSSHSAQEGKKVADFPSFCATNTLLAPSVVCLPSSKRMYDVMQKPQ